MVGGVLDEVAARGDRTIALLAFVTQAVVRLFALWRELGIDGAFDLSTDPPRLDIRHSGGTAR
jgi:hypothetical protein